MSTKVLEESSRPHQKMLRAFDAYTTAVRDGTVALETIYRTQKEFDAAIEEEASP